MKKINSILAGLLLTASLFLTQQATAQAPQKMSYQSVIRNSSNVLLANTAVGIKISVLQGSASGTPVYVETQTASTNGNGLLSIQIGTGIVVTGSFAAINWAAGPYFIKTETDPAGGSNYSITGTQEMLSVPYALNGITAAQANAIVSMQSQITALQSQVSIPTIQIGTQLWSKYNLDVAFYRNGDPIPQVTDAGEWAGLTTGAWCYYNNDSTLGNTYGKLYNWYAVNDPRGLAPQGWHIPTNAEWTTLSDTLGGGSAAGGKMKEAGTLNWASPNAGGNNNSGFAGLPGGNHSSNGQFYFLNNLGYWWSATNSGTTEFAYNYSLNRSNGSLLRNNSRTTFGYTIRCLRD